MRNFFGRKVIYTSCSDLSISSIVKIINGAMLRHEENSRQIAYLEGYFTGKQPILDRNKVIRQDVNNKIVVNNAYSIVRNANGYFLGEPIKYASKDAECRENVEILNNMVDSVDKACGDTQLEEWQSICGTAYRLICVDEGSENKDSESAPFEVPILDPKCTSVIYSSEVEHKPVLAFTYCDILDDNGNSIGRKYTIYDKTYQYIFTTKGVNTQIKPEDLLQDYPKPHFLGDVPIIECPNNQWRLGDLEKLKEQLAISITSSTGQPADIKFVNSQVNQNEAETLAKTLIDYVYAVTRIPDRKTRSNGGGDTGEAVYLRDGWAYLEVVARTKERYFRRSEKQMLKIICKILKVFRNIGLKPMHIEPTFVRNRTNNLLNKAQAMSILKELGFIDPIDIVTLGGISDNPIDLVKRELAYYQDKGQEKGDGNNQVRNKNDEKIDNFTRNEVSAL